MQVDLPQPVGPDEEHELAAADLERDALEADGAAVVDLAHVAELDDGNLEPAGRAQALFPWKRGPCGARKACRAPVFQAVQRVCVRGRAHGAARRQRHAVAQEQVALRLEHPDQLAAPRARAAARPRRSSAPGARRRASAPAHRNSSSTRSSRSRPSFSAGPPSQSIERTPCSVRSRSSSGRERAAPLRPGRSPRRHSRRARFTGGRLGVGRGEHDHARLGVLEQRQVRREVEPGAHDAARGGPARAPRARGARAARRS